MPGKNTNVRPTIGTQLNVTMMKNIKKPLVTGGITAGVTYGNLQDGFVGAKATAGLNNASIDLNFGYLCSDNFGVAGSVGVGYVQGKQEATYSAIDFSLNSSLQESYNKDFFVNEANKHFATGKNAAYDELDMEVLIDGKKYNTSGDFQHPAHLKVNIPEASETFLNKQFDCNAKAGALYVNDKGNFELQLGVRMDAVKNYAPKLERTIEGTVNETYKMHVGNVFGLEENFTTVVDEKANSDIKIHQNVQFNNDAQIRVSPYVGLKCNVTNGLNLTAEASLMGGTVGINYMF